MPPLQRQVERWPELPYGQWKDTYQTLHRWLQIIGKIQLSKTPWTNHAWQSALLITPRGIGTSLIHDRDQSFSIELALATDSIHVVSSTGKSLDLELEAESVASFYRKIARALGDLGIDLQIYGRPNELPDDLAFAEDEIHRSYDGEYAERFWRILLQVDRVLGAFRARYLGKATPPQFFWGALDIAASRYSGRKAPKHPGGYPHLPDLVVQDGASHEHFSSGFWPGNEFIPYPAFYAYMYPNPPGFESAPVLPAEAFYHPQLQEYLLPYDVVRRSRSPDAMILDFFQSSYEAAAKLAGWDRPALEESPYLQELQKKYPVKKIKPAQNAA